MGFNDKVLDLVDRLLFGTEQGGIRWTETDRPYSYLTELAPHNILVATQDDDGQNPFQLVLMSKKGGVIDMISDSVNTRLDHALEDLHRAARRNSSGIDRVVEELLRELPERPEPPF